MAPNNFHHKIVSQTTSSPPIQNKDKSETAQFRPIHAMVSNNNVHHNHATTDRTPEQRTMSTNSSTNQTETSNNPPKCTWHPHNAKSKQNTKQNQKEEAQTKQCTKHTEINFKMTAANQTNAPHNDPRTTEIYAWHLELNKTNPTTLTTISKSKLFPALTILNPTADEYITCSACAAGKSRHAPHHKEIDTSTHPPKIISSDTMDPIAPTSTDMHRHIITFVDKFSRYLIAHPIKTSANVPNITQKTIAKM